MPERHRANCIDYIFLFSVSLILWHLDPWSILVTLPLPELIPRDSKGLPWKHAFNIQDNQSRVHTPNRLLYQILTRQASIPLALNHPRARYQTARNHPCSPVYWNYSKYPIPNLLSVPALPRPFLPTKNVNKDSRPCCTLSLSASWLILVLPRVALRGMVCHASWF